RLTKTIDHHICTGFCQLGGHGQTDTTGRSCYDRFFTFQHRYLVSMDNRELKPQVYSPACTAGKCNGLVLSGIIKACKTRPNTIGPRTSALPPRTSACAGKSRPYTMLRMSFPNIGRD